MIIRIYVHNSFRCVSVLQEILKAQSLTHGGCSLYLSSSSLSNSQDSGSGNTLRAKTMSIWLLSYFPQCPTLVPLPDWTDSPWCGRCIYCNRHRHNHIKVWIKVYLWTIGLTSFSSLCNYQNFHIGYHLLVSETSKVLFFFQSLEDLHLESTSPQST